MKTKDKAREAFADFNAAMQSLDNTAKNLAIGCMQSDSNEIWNAVEQAKAGYQAATQARDKEIADLTHDVNNALKAITEYDAERQANREAIKKVISILDEAKTFDEMCAALLDEAKAELNQLIGDE